MITKIKQGNSFYLDYTLTYDLNGVCVPLPISDIIGLKVGVQVATHFSVQYPTYTISGNVISLHITPEFQKTQGTYRLLLTGTFQSEQISRNPIAYQIVADIEQESSQSSCCIDIDRISVNDSLGISNGHLNEPEMWEALGKEGEEQIHPSHIYEATKDFATETYVTNASKLLFIDLWNQAAGTYGKYNETTKFFELNGHLNITYDQALEIYYSTGGLDVKNLAIGATFSPNIITNLPLTYGANTSVATSIAQSLGQMTNLETLNLASRYNPTAVFGRISSLLLFTYQSNKLKRIIGVIRVTDNFDTGQVLNNNSIEDLQLDFSLFTTSTNKTFQISSPNLSLQSLEYFINNYKSGNTGTLTVTLHANAYARLTPALISLATSKKLTFVTV